MKTNVKMKYFLTSFLLILFILIQKTDGYVSTEQQKRFQIVKNGQGRYGTYPNFNNDYDYFYTVLR